MKDHLSYKTTTLGDKSPISGSTNHCPSQSVIDRFYVEHYHSFYSCICVIIIVVLLVMVGRDLCSSTRG